MNDFRADLHCHSTSSDGTCTPQQLIDLAIKSGLQGLSITDHDTTQAYTIALDYAEKVQFDLLPGIEFSASHEGDSVHVLGYAFSPFHPKILELCAQHHHRRELRNQEILARLTSLGFPLTLQDVSEASATKLETIGRPHIANALVKRGYASSIKDAFKLYLAEGKAAYAKGDPISVEETLETLHAAKGLAIIAHPHLIENFKLKKLLIEMNFDGLEGYYGTFSLEENERWIKIAQKKNWLITGGSDYHGDIKPNVTLGSSWVSRDTFEILQKHYRLNAT
jgi:3',5'-nucleoside bisphosphate phosphatase